MAEFVIVFREVLEASLVVGIIYLLIEKLTNPLIFLSFGMQFLRLS